MAVFAGYPKDTLTFLADLCRHNTKAWFDDHRSAQGVARDRQGRGGEPRNYRLGHWRKQLPVHRWLVDELQR